MKPQSRKRIFLTLFVLILSAGSLSAQTEQSVQDVKRFFSGQRMLVTFRDGGALYGTYTFLEVHFCPSGKYVTFGQSRKQTILDNQQVNNWRDDGVWDVTAAKDEVLLRYLSASGERNVVPVRQLPNGQVWIGDGISIQRQGLAQCR